MRGVAPITLTAVWGNDDAESEIRVSRKNWVRICCGDGLTRVASRWYEGKRFCTYWNIVDRKVGVTNNEGGDCFLGNLEDLYVWDNDLGKLIEPPAEEGVRVAKRGLPTQGR